MLPSNPFPQLIPLRVNSALGRLAAAIWMDEVPVAVRAAAPTARDIAWSLARKRPLSVVTTPSSWGRLYDQRWFQIRVDDPVAENTWLVWRDQAEATLFVNGEPVGGFDPAHRRHRLPHGHREFWIESHCVQTAIWHPEATGLSAAGSLFEGASLCRRNEEAWQAWHDLKCLCDVAHFLRCKEDPSAPETVSPGCLQHPFEEHSPVVRRMYREMDGVVDELDARGIPAARRVLAEVYRRFRTEDRWMTAVLCGHAHIDLVWLWPERIGEHKAVHTFATVDSLMTDYPELCFTYSQPASYEAVRRREPKLARRVARRIRSGRWQPTGVLHVESDTQLPCGEALLRSFLIGQEEFVKLRGRPATLAWLPDVFGYAGCLPQLIRLAGARFFFTTKLTWNFLNRFPYSSFVWRGTDGSEVVAHVTQGGGYCAQATVEEVHKAAWSHRQSDVHGEFLQPTGFGDGGGGPTMEMCERARRIGLLPGLPRVAWGGPEEFFDRLEPLRDQLPVYRGECYLEGHRGTFTTHGAVKAAYRALECALFVGEAAACLTGRRRDLTGVWKRLCFAQFHDYLPGSGCWDVYREALPELHALTKHEQEETARMVSARTGRPCLLNPHAVPLERWIGINGKLERVRLPALSGIAVSDALCPAPPAPTVTGRSAGNGMVEFSLDDAGEICRLVFSGEEIPLRGAAGGLLMYRDQPARFEAWDVDRQTLTGGIRCDAPATVTACRDGVARAGFRVKRGLPLGGSAEVGFFVEAGSPLLHVEINLDWTEPHALLKLIVPTQFAAGEARFGAPFGSVLRSQSPEGPISEAMWEVPFSRWLAVFDEGERRGVFAVTENRFGATVRDGVIGISLVRSPLVAGCDGLKFARPVHLSRIPDPDAFSDRGAHFLRLALGVYRSDLPRTDHPAMLAETQFTDPIAYRGKSWPSPLAGLEGGDTLLPCAAVPLEAGDFLLRLHEVGGQRGEVMVKATSGWRIRSCDARGKASGRPTQRFAFAPHQIVSLRFERTLR